jgi:arsenite-transporting ATPase
MSALLHRPLSALLGRATRYFFFTGKGGVGKTSLACATALALAESGKKTLLVSTDPASNLDEVLGLELGRMARPVPGTDGLFALNIDPEEVAADYRERVVGPMRGLLPEPVLKEIEEQLSGACTMEIASFDEFAGYLAGEGASAFTHIVFDTAPTGHTLRLMALSQAWTGFLGQARSGNSCLGPLAGLEKQRRIYEQAVDVLKDAAQTSVVLVSRAQSSALREARRTAGELADMGVRNQSLAINGWFEAASNADPVASAWMQRQDEAVAAEVNFISSLPFFRAPLLPTNLVGLDALRRFFSAESAPQPLPKSLPGLDALVDKLLATGHGVILTMGKGGVGKTTLASALALALHARGATVRLSTTDPAAHLTDALGTHLEGLQIDRIDPKAETLAYVEEVMATKGAGMDAGSLALLEEDLRSPCTMEIAVFRAFARTVAQGEEGFVVLDTAPTGHTLLLLDATQSHHRELARQSRSVKHPDDVERLLPRLRDPEFTRILLITVPEATPVHEAFALQADLQRAGIHPCAWIINQSLAATGTTDPLLAARGLNETRYIQEILDTQMRDVFLVPWSTVEPVGPRGLQALILSNTQHNPKI